MKISLLTDAPKHNLALMKLSAWHKEAGDEVYSNDETPLFPADKTYASILFEKNHYRWKADLYGGPAVDGSVLPPEVENCRPDYDLFHLDYSLGYTFRPCSRGCEFCKVSRMNHPDRTHHSIWDFHDSRFTKIRLLNNNTFMDPHWRETFGEIWDADLAVLDENGYDLRLLDDEKAEALHRTKWATPLHFAWDRIEDEEAIVRGLKLLGKHHIRSTRNGVYVLIGRNTTEADDLHRCQVIDDHGLTPYPMPFTRTPYTKAFKRFINLHYYRQYPTVAEAWDNYGATHKAGEEPATLLLEPQPTGKRNRP